jgi:hypothetical protein
LLWGAYTSQALLSDLCTFQAKEISRFSKNPPLQDAIKLQNVLAQLGTL